MIDQGDDPLEALLIRFIESTNVDAIDVEECLECALLCCAACTACVTRAFLIVVVCGRCREEARKDYLRLSVIIASDVIVKLAHIMRNHNLLISGTDPALPVAQVDLTTGKYSFADILSDEDLARVHFWSKIIETNKVPRSLEGRC